MIARVKNREPLYHDIDIATSATPEEVMAIFESSDMGFLVVPTGLAFGTVTVVCPGEDRSKCVFEVTSFREDIETDGRRAVVSFTKDAYLDSIRRDFTMNALYMDLDTEEIYDPHGGVNDIKMGVIMIGWAGVAYVNSMLLHKVFERYK